MSDYDFATLSPYDFEYLVRDLLQKELGITLESFPTGKDDGIDLRYHTSIDNHIIIQVKHYSKSNFSTLFNHLKSRELAKVRKLDPSRYILVTSKGLTPGNKNKIQKLFGKYILSTADIYGKNDIDNLLDKFPEIEKKSFKLWLTSSTVLERLLHSEIFNQSDLEMNKIRKKIEYYVENENFVKAKKLLDEVHYCIITGIPGIGKTTLAEILIVKYLDMGYELVKISKDISEAYEAFESKAKQIFYYDDFLGQTSFEEKLTKNEDQRLISFLKDIERYPNKRLILTTRDYILNKAKIVYEKLDQPCIDFYKYTVNLSSYNDFDKAKILYNHLYFSGISHEYKNALLKDKNYWKIIRHKNFNPRIIETMTESIEYLDIDSAEYVSKFLNFLDKPILLWEHAFLNQISNASKNLLLELASLDDSAPIDTVEKSFKSIQIYKFNTYGFHANPNDFAKALRELDGNFITINKFISEVRISFHNPSIKDFIEDYLSKNYSEVIDICKSAESFEQCMKLSKYIKTSELNILIFQLEKNLFKNDFKSTIHNFSIEQRLLSLLKLYEKFRDDRIIGLVHTMMDALIKHIHSNHAVKETIVQIVSSLKKMQIDYNERQFKAAIKSFFLKDLDVIYNFGYCISLQKANPDFFMKNELRDLNIRFEEYYKEFYACLDDGYIPDGEFVLELDQELIRESLDTLESAKEIFDIDIQNGIKKLDDLSKKFDEATQEEKEADITWINRKLKEDDEIDSLFDILKDAQ